MTKRVLIVVAHSDDEVLGCGGTIVKHVSIGDCVQLLVVADGVTSRGQNCAVDVRNSALEVSCKCLGISSYKLLNFPDNRLDSVPLLDIVQSIEPELESYKPHIIYTHSFADLNIDHTIVHKAVITACRPQYGREWLEQILSFYVASSSEWASPSMNSPFIPNKFVDIAPYIEKKMDALKAYDVEMRDYPHPRSYISLENTAKYFGNSVSLEFAESFCIERIIERS